MIGDHHGRTTGRATLLVRAADGILGTHIINEYERAAKKPRSGPVAEFRNPSTRLALATGAAAACGAGSWWFRRPV